MQERPRGTAGSANSPAGPASDAAIGAAAATEPAVAALIAVFVSATFRTQPLSFGRGASWIAASFQIASKS